jgi:hypothetical protein
VRKIIVALGAAAAAGLFYAHRIEPERLEITRHDVTLPRLAAPFDGYRIMQISDIHIDSWMTYARLQKIVDLVNAQSPDLVAITGDFITDRVRFVVDELVGALSRLKAVDGVVAVPGNHDYRAGEIGRVRRVMRAAGIRDLSNAIYEVARGGGSLFICGVDDLIFRRARLDRVLAQLPDAGAAVLLAHEPDFVDIAAPTRRFDLQLSGHTHGGQIHLPVIGSPYAPIYGFRYRQGWHDVDGMRLYVNRGVGMVTAPVRFNCRPEITVLNLRSPSV